MADRDDAIRAAQNDATDDERTDDGTIRMDALNKRLEEAGFDKATAEERDAALAEETRADSISPVGGRNPTANSLGRAEPEPSGLVAGNPVAPQQSGGDAPIRRTEENPDGMSPAAASRIEASTAGANPPDRSVQSPTVKPTGKTTKIVLRNAATSPLLVYVHGVGQFRLPVDPQLEQEVPEEIVAALRASDADFEEVR